MFWLEYCLRTYSKDESFRSQIGFCWDSFSYFKSVNTSLSSWFASKSGSSFPRVKLSSELSTHSASPSSSFGVFYFKNSISLSIIQQKISLPGSTYTFTSILNVSLLWPLLSWPASDPKTLITPCNSCSMQFSSLPRPISYVKFIDIQTKDSSNGSTLIERYKKFTPSFLWFKLSRFWPILSYNLPIKIYSSLISLYALPSHLSFVF